MTVTNYELDTKIEAIEARMDGRIRHIEQIFEHMQEDNKIIKQELRNTQWWVLGTSVAIIGVLIGILAITNSWQQATMTLIASKIDSLQQTHISSRS